MGNQRDRGGMDHRAPEGGAVASPNVASCVALYVALFVALLALMCVRPLAVHAQDVERLPKTDHASAIDGVLDEPMWRGYNEAR